MKRISCLLLLLTLLLSPAFAEEGFPSFSTTDMEGHAVTQEIFSEYDLTVVNVWATWCGYCVEEMPCFAELKTALPDNANFITLCTDASAERALASDILRSSGANFQTLIVNDEIDAYLSAHVTAFPTTLFLDSEGKPVAEALMGVPSLEDPLSAYESIIRGILQMMEA